MNRVSSNATLAIRLRPKTDPAEPTLQAVVIDGYGRAISVVRVTSPHPIWHGAELRISHFRLLPRVKANQSV